MTWPPEMAGYNERPRGRGLTGHMTGSVVLHCVTVSDFLSFFCLSKVIETQSAELSSGDEWSKILPPLMKVMFWRQSCFACCCSAFGTLLCLHNCMAQKCVAAASLPIAQRSSVDWEERMRQWTQTGKAFCFFSFGSFFAYNLSCHCRSWPTLRSASLWGSSHPFSLKVAATALMVFATDFLARGPSPGLKNRPSHTATAKAPMSSILCCWGMLSRK
jgi:hypothetical protein